LYEDPKITIKLNEGDVVLREIYRIKDELSASYGHDLDRLFEETRKHEKASIAEGWQVAPVPSLRSKKIVAPLILKDEPASKPDDRPRKKS